MAPRTVYANLTDGLQPFNLWDQSLADMGNLGMIPCTAAGTNAIVLTPLPAAFAPTVSNPPQQLQNFTFVGVGNSTGPVTINGLKLYKEDAATQASTNDILLNVLYGIAYNSALNSAAGGYQIVFPITSILNPVISGATISGSTITMSTYNGNTWTAGTGILTIAALKTLTISNSLTFTGTDGTSFAFPATSDTVVTLTAAQALTNKTLNGNTLTAGTWTLTGVASKTLTFNNSLTLAGTDGTTMTFPATSATLARTDASNSFTGTQTIGALVVTTVNGNTVTAGTGVLTLAAGKTLTANNSLTFAGTDATTITFQATDTYVGRATTDTLTNKTLDTAGTGNVLKINGTQLTSNTGTTAVNVLQQGPTINQANLVGTTTNDNAAAGSVGEYVESVIVTGSAVSLVTGTAKNVTTILLTAGDWDVDTSAYFNSTGTTVVTGITLSINPTTDNTLDLTAGRWGQLLINNPAGPPTINTSVPPYRLSLSGTTTIRMVVQGTFSASTLAAWGIIRARRVR